MPFAGTTPAARLWVRSPVAFQAVTYARSAIPSAARGSRCPRGTVRRIAPAGQPSGQHRTRLRVASIAARLCWGGALVSGSRTATRQRRGRRLHRAVLMATVLWYRVRNANDAPPAGSRRPSTTPTEATSQCATQVRPFGIADQARAVTAGHWYGTGLGLLNWLTDMRASWRDPRGSEGAGLRRRYAYVATRCPPIPRPGRRRSGRGRAFSSPAAVGAGRRGAAASASIAFCELFDVAVGLSVAPGNVLCEAFPRQLPSCRWVNRTAGGGSFLDLP